VKWYKHMSDCLDDPVIFDAVSQFGGDGYMVFHGCLEIIAREFDEKSPGICTVSIAFLTKKFQVSKCKLVKIMAFFEKKEKLFYQISGGQISINCPNFIRLKDNYTKDKLASNLQASCKKLSARYIEEEVEEEKDNTPPIPPPPKKSVCDPAKKYRDRFTDEGKRLHEEALEVLHYLNEQADRHLPDNYNGLSVILDRLHDGYSAESLKKIIDTKLCDPHFQKRRNLYTPETLFKAENIQRYLCETPEDFTGDTAKPAGGSKVKSDYPIDATF